MYSELQVTQLVTETNTNDAFVVAPWAVCALRVSADYFSAPTDQKKKKVI